MTITEWIIQLSIFGVLALLLGHGVATPGEARKILGIGRI